MSAPDTNIDREAKRHKPALIGIAFALGVAALLAAGFGLFAISGWDEALENDGAAPVQQEMMTN